MIEMANIRGEDPGVVAAYYVNDLPGVFGDLENASEWFGAGALQLGLHGPVTEAVLKELLSGRVGDDPGTRVYAREDSRPRLGLEILFAPPKSVSVEALIGKKQDVVAADAEAVRYTMKLVEKLVRTRNRVDGKQGKEFTNAIVAALLRHETSRKGDPHLHTHGLVINATLRADGQLRAINNDLIKQNRTQFIHIYRARLERNLRAAGYEIRKEAGGSFELANYTAAQLDAFSSGKKAMNAYLASSGIAPDVASRAQKHWAWRKTREAKPSERDLQQLHAEWETVARSVGIEFQAIAPTVEASVEAEAEPAPADESAPEAIVDTALAPANVWLGKGAHLLNLRGEIDQADYEAALAGFVKDRKGQALPTRKPVDPNKSYVERLATTVELSAPRGVAVQALFGGDERLIAAHDAAVAYAASLIDKTARAVTILNEGKGKQKQTAESLAERSILNRTGNAVIAASRKQHNNAGSVDLYTQLVVMNLTQDFRGRWTQMDSGLLFARRKLVQAEYENRLAKLVQESGYTLVRLPNGSFDLKQMAQADIQTLTEKDRGFYLRAPRAETRAQKVAMNGWLKGAMATHHGLDPAALMEQGRAKVADLGMDLTQPPRVATAAAANATPSAVPASAQTPETNAGSEGFEGGDDNAIFRQMEGLSREDDLADLQALADEDADWSRDSAAETEREDWDPRDIEREEALADAYEERQVDQAERYDHEPVEFDPFENITGDRQYDRDEGRFDLDRDERGAIDDVVAFDAAMYDLRAERDEDYSVFAETHAHEPVPTEPPAVDPIEAQGPTAEEEALAEQQRAEEALHLTYAKEAIIYALNALSESQAVVFEHELLEKAFRYNVVHGTERKYLLQALKAATAEGTALIAADTTYHEAGQISKKGKDEHGPTRAQWIRARTDGHTSIEEATRRVEEDIARGRLVADEARYTTPKALQAEIDIVTIEKQMRGAVTPILGTEAAEAALGEYVADMNRKAAGAARKTGASPASFLQTILRKLGLTKVSAEVKPARQFKFEPTQLAAAKMVLSTNNGIVGIQGIAGTGKTFTVDGITHVAKANGYEVVMIAPYRGQVAALRAEGNKADTMAAYLGEDARNKTKMEQDAPEPLNAEAVAAYVAQVMDAAKASSPKQMLVVDEAGVISAADMARVEAIVLQKGAHMVALGDVGQTKPIGASPALSILQQSGMQTVEMSDVQRQSTDAGKAAVLAAARRDIKTALAHIGDENIHEVEDDRARYNTMAQQFTAMTPAERDSTIIVTATNDAKQEINERIRAALGNAGHGEKIESLTPVSMSREEKKRAGNYKVGDIIINEAGEDPTLERHKQYKILRRGTGNALILEDSSGATKTLELDRANPNRISLYHADVREYAPGDMIRSNRKLTVYKRDENGEIVRTKYKNTVYKAGDPGTPVKHFECDSGQLFKIATINKGFITLLPFKEGKQQPGMHILALSSMERLSFEYGWATSVHASQGIKSREAIVELDTKRRPTRHEVFYVAISRAVDKMNIFTDSKELLDRKIARVSEKYAALDLSIDESGHALAAQSAAHRLSNGVDELARRRAARAQTTAHASPWQNAVGSQASAVAATAAPLVDDTLKNDRIERQKKGFSL